MAENAPPPPASHAVVTGEDVQKKLVEVLGFDVKGAMNKGNTHLYCGYVHAKG